MSNMTLSNIFQPEIKKPLRISLYGVDGVGKTTFAASAPNPIFISTESGDGGISAPQFPEPENYYDLLNGIGELITGEHPFETLVIDSMDWCETLMREQVCINHGVKFIEEIPYGKGHKELPEQFEFMRKALTLLWTRRKMNIILISHAEIMRFNDPENESYDRYQLKLHPDISGKVREWSDMNLFYNYETFVKETAKGFGNKEVKGKSTARRIIHTQRTAAFDAKTRYKMPSSIPINDDLNGWDTIYQYYLQDVEAKQQRVKSIEKAKAEELSTLAPTPLPEEVQESA